MIAKRRKGFERNSGDYIPFLKRIGRRVSTSSSSPIANEDREARKAVAATGTQAGAGFGARSSSAMGITQAVKISISRKLSA